MLLCPVRDCHLPLSRAEQQLLCPQGHSFDIARSGYINLLQPQDRRSKLPGDSKAAVDARRRLHARGFSAPLLRAIADVINPLASDIVLDAGCGDGFYLGTLAHESGFAAHGIDISTPSIEAAARRYPTCQWIVANADRFIPYAALSFSLILSITARMNPAEFHRTLHRDGRLLIALPAPDDLTELRGAGKDRVVRTVETFRKDFNLVGQRRVTTVASLDASAVEDVLLSIYRPLQSKPVEAKQVTFSLDLLLFRKADKSPSGT